MSDDCKGQLCLGSVNEKCSANKDLKNGFAFISQGGDVVFVGPATTGLMKDAAPQWWPKSCNSPAIIRGSGSGAFTVSGFRV